MEWNNSTLINNLVAYYKFDGNANDSVGSNHGTVTGATQTSSGKINQAYDFDGVNDYISIGNPVTNTFSVSLWVKANAFSNGTHMITLGGWTPNPSATNYFYVGTTDDSKFFAYNHVGGITSGICTTGTWYHIVYVNNPSGNAELYVNGVSQGTVSGQSYFSSGYCGIGNLRSQDSCINGKIDEVAIWSRIITSSEVIELYNSGNGLSYPFINNNNNNFLTMSLGCEF